MAGGQRVAATNGCNNLKFWPSCNNPHSQPGTMQPAATCSFNNPNTWPRPMQRPALVFLKTSGTTRVLASNQ